MAANNMTVEAVISSPDEKAIFRLEHLMPPDQLQTRLMMVLTIHHRHDRAYGNAWLLSPSKEPIRLIKEIIFSKQPKESQLFIVLGELSEGFNAKRIELGRVGELYLSYLNWQIQELLEKRAEGIFTSSDLEPLEKARKIFNLIVLEGMEAKLIWVKQIHELIFEGGALSLYDAWLCEAALYHAQMKCDLGRKYLD
jgi:hypothetical protein